ncbi:MAG: GxxExxY protein [Planctomycetota bacterium]
MTDAGADDPLSRRVIGCAIEVHRALGPGLLESAYEACFAAELSHAGLVYRRQVPISIEYRGEAVDAGYFLDLVVEDALVVELKSVERVVPIHVAQLHTYLRLSGIRTGLLINFNVTKLIDSVTRRVVG